MARRRLYEHLPVTDLLAGTPWFGDRYRLNMPVWPGPDPRKSISVVYLLFSAEDQLLYVGQSARLHVRLYEHGLMTFQAWLAYPGVDRRTALEVERELHLRYQPPLNTVHDWEGAIATAAALVRPAALGPAR